MWLFLNELMSSGLTLWGWGIWTVEGFSLWDPKSKSPANLALVRQEWPPYSIVCPAHCLQFGPCPVLFLATGNSVPLKPLQFLEGSILWCSHNPLSPPNGPSRLDSLPPSLLFTQSTPGHPTLPKTYLSSSRILPPCPVWLPPSEHLCNFTPPWTVGRGIHSQLKQHTRFLAESESTSAEITIKWNNSNLKIAQKRKMATLLSLSRQRFKNDDWASRMAQQVKVPVTKPDYLSLNPRTHMKEGEYGLPQAVLWLP